MNLIGRGLGIVSLALVVRSFGISSNSCSRILPRTSTVLIQQQQQQHQQEQRNTFRTFSSALNMVRTRGLEKQNLESASPEGTCHQDELNESQQNKKCLYRSFTRMRSYTLIIRLLFAVYFFLLHDTTVPTSYD
jgi:hypothetical protein